MQQTQSFICVMR